MLLLSACLLLAASAVHANVISSCSQNGLFAMTWDDGASDNIPKLLPILAAKNAKVTFHITTVNLTDPTVQGYVQKIVAGGHLIGIRTEANWDLAKMSSDQLKSAIARQSAILSQFCGYYPKAVRVPYDMSKNAKVVGDIESTGAVVTIQSLDSYDASAPDVNKIKSAFRLGLSLKPASSYSIISVQHDAVNASIQATSDIIDNIKKAGYKLVTLDQCLGKGDWKKNKTALKGGKGGDAGDLPTLDGSAGSVGGGSGSSSSDSSSSGQKKGGFLKGLGNAAAGSYNTISFIGMAALMLAGLLVI